MNNIYVEQLWRQDIGDITSSDHGTFIWTLPHIIVHTKACCCASPWFTVDGENWCLVLVPNYNNNGILKDNVVTGIYLKRKDSNELKQSYNIKIGYFDSEEKATYIFTAKTNDSICGKWDNSNLASNIAFFCGFVKIFCVIQKVEDVPEDLLSRITTTVEEDESSENEEGEKKEEQQAKGIERLAQNLRQLFLDGENSDVVLEVDQHKFRVHKAIVAARSPVFASMLQHEMAEKTSGIINIPDCSAAAFKTFLLYLYAGSADISTNNVFNLYYAADKYQVDDLKEECVKYMMDNLSADTFCDVIALALRHGESKLQKEATRFFCENIKEVIKTVQWQKYLSENATHANELLIKALDT